MFMWSPEETAQNLFHNQEIAKAVPQPANEEELMVVLKNRLMTAKLGWQPRMYNPDLKKWLHRVDVPTLIIWGDDDKLHAGRVRPGLPRPDPELRARGHRRVRAPAPCREGAGVHRQGRQLHRRSRVMKFYMMHLMPYADLDLDYDQKYNSAWITLPNSYYDPKKGAKLYNRYLDELEYADQLGFDGVCVNEHHQNAYGLMPQPGVMAGALARRTKKVKIAILGRALPLLNNPVTVAEEFAMVDNITEGRFIAGFVRGIGAEYHAWSCNPALSHERFHEAHDLIVRAWTETGPFALRGRALPVRIRQPVAAALPERSASADLDPLAGLERDHRVGLAPGPPLHLPADLHAGGDAGQVHADVQGQGGRSTATRRPRTSSAGRCRSMSPRPTRSRAARRSRTSRTS